MERNISLGKEIKITNAMKQWKEILPILQNEEEEVPPVNIDMKAVESVDGAGLQMVLYVLSAAEKAEEKIRITGLSGKIEQLSLLCGFNTGKSEVKE